MYGSSIAPVVVVLFLVIVGALFWLPFFDQISPLSMRAFFAQAPLFLAIFAPALTMGSLASPARSGALQWMMTSPARAWEIALGKILASWSLVCVACGLTLSYPVSLAILGARQGVDLDLGAVLAGYIGLVMLGGAYSAIGVMASSFTKDQVVALLSSFTSCFTLFMLDRFVLLAEPDSALRHLAALSSSHHFQSIARGVLALSDLVYFLSVMILSWSIASLGIERWRQ